MIPAARRFQAFLRGLATVSEPADRYGETRLAFSRRALPGFLAAPLAALALGLAAPASADYSGHASAAAFIERMTTEHGFEREAVESLLRDAERQQSILDAIARPAEKTKAWYEYREIFLNDRREREGIEFMREHRATLARAQAETGVPAEIIVAILGVETYYGRVAGSYRVLDALSTLAFDYPKRSPFFTSELENFLLLTREQGLDPTVLKGSYAGAMGYGQFMPSSYRAYADDFDDDGVADIWNNPVDAIGSVANYLARHGWREGEPIVSAASAAPGASDELFDGKLKPVRSVEEFAAAGVVADEALDGKALATAMRFELADGHEYWLGLHNLYVITRYNHSSMYAMSVFQLSQRIAEGAAS
jgi:membrane-bound lytic murein transglycosylase B